LLVSAWGVGRELSVWKWGGNGRTVDTERGKIEVVTVGLEKLPKKWAHCAERKSLEE